MTSDQPMCETPGCEFSSHDEADHPHGRLVRPVATIRRRTLKPTLYRSLRRLGFSRRDSLRALWHGADIDTVASA